MPIWVMSSDVYFSLRLSVRCRLAPSWHIPAALCVDETLPMILQLTRLATTTLLHPF
jgi:hypothetical protein